MDTVEREKECLMRELFVFITYKWNIIFIYIIICPETHQPPMTKSPSTNESWWTVWWAVYIRLKARFRGEGNWFHIRDTLGIKERQNWEIVGFCSWTRQWNECRQDDSCVGLPWVARGRRERRVLPSRNHGNTVKEGQEEWSLGKRTGSLIHLIAFFWTAYKRWGVVEVQNSTLDWALSDKQGGCTN